MEEEYELFLAPNVKFEDLKKYGFTIYGDVYEYQMKEFRGYDSCDASLLVFAKSREVAMYVSYNKNHNCNNVDEGDTLIDSAYDCEILYTLIKDGLIMVKEKKK